MVSIAGSDGRQESTAKERIQYYQKELRTLNMPRSYREQVLCNVYEYLLQSCLAQENIFCQVHGRASQALKDTTN